MDRTPMFVSDFCRSGKSPSSCLRQAASHRMAADGTLSVSPSTDVALPGARARYRMDSHLNSTVAVDRHHSRPVGLCWSCALDIYLVDGTYELFRHYYALPSMRDSD